MGHYGLVGTLEEYYTEVMCRYRGLGQKEVTFTRVLWTFYVF